MIYLALGIFLLGCIFIGLLVLLVDSLGFVESMEIFMVSIFMTIIIVGASVLIDKGIKEIKNTSQVEVIKGE